MHLAKGAGVLVGALVLLGSLFIVCGEQGESQAQLSQGKTTMWADDVLVHQGYVSRYLRNGYSADYDDDWDVIFAAVTGLLIGTR
jgi:hypothetical protein